jgi:hypothetical protein
VDSTQATGVHTVIGNLAILIDVGGMQNFFDQIVRIFERCDPFSVVLVPLPPRDSRWFIFSKPCLSAGKSTLPFFFVSNCSHSALILASRSSRDSPSIAVCCCAILVSWLALGGRSFRGSAGRERSDEVQSRCRACGGGLLFLAVGRRRVDE